MDKTKALEVLNQVSEGIEFKDMRVSGTVGSFLMSEKYVEGSIWQVDIHVVDFTDKKSVEKFLEESSCDGYSESFSTLEQAEAEFTKY